MPLALTGLPDALAEVALVLGPTGRLELLEALAAKTSPLSGTGDFIRLVSDAAAGQLHPADAQDFIVGILALSNASGSSAAVGDEESLAAALRRSPELAGVLRDLPGALDEVSAFIAAVANDSRVRVCARGHHVAGEYDRVFKSSRSFSDVRPVMAEDVARTPQAAVVVEVLQIEVWSRTGATETLRIALDENDLMTLAATVARAQEKRVGIEKMLADAGVPEIQVSSPSDDSLSSRP